MISPLLDISAPVKVDTIEMNGRSYDVYCGCDREHPEFYHCWCCELAVDGVGKTPEAARSSCRKAMMDEISRRGAWISQQRPLVKGGQGRSGRDVEVAAWLAGACLLAGVVGFIWMMR